MLRSVGQSVPGSVGPSGSQLIPFSGDPNICLRTPHPLRVRIIQEIVTYHKGQLQYNAAMNGVPFGNELRWARAAADQLSAESHMKEAKEIQPARDAYGGLQ